jgi:uncharacterized spore protein YtfJ
MSSTERSSGLNDVLNPQWLRRTHAQTPGAHLQIVWRGHFSLGNTREEEEGPTTSTLRADSAVSDGQVSVGEETCGSDATQVQQEANSSMRALSSERVRRGASVVAVCAGVGEDRDVVVEQLDDEQSMNSDEEMRREEEQQTESEIWTTSERSYRSFEERRRERVENTNGVAFDVMNQSNLRGEIGRAEIGGTAARAQARDLNATAREYEAVGREFNLNATELIARAPPMGFRIPGTAAGEGVARAHAAGNVLPDVLRAKRVTSLDAEFPVCWDPVALLCLYPGSERSQEAFLKLAQSLKARREEMPEDVAETANVIGGTSVSNNTVTIPERTGRATTARGSGVGLLRERITASTQSFNDRSSLNSSLSHGNEREPGAEVVLSPLSTSVREHQNALAANATSPPTAGSGDHTNQSQRTSSVIEVSQTAIGVAARVELAEGFVAYIVSQEQLPDLAYEAVAKERDLPPEGGGYVPGNTTNVQRQPAQQQQQLRMPGVARERFLSDAAKIRNNNNQPSSTNYTNNDNPTIEPLWAIIQTVEPLPAPMPIANVPAPDSRPTRGILKGWTASQLGNYSKETGAVAGFAGGITQGATSEREPLHRRRTQADVGHLLSPLNTSVTINPGQSHHHRQPAVVARVNTNTNNNNNNNISDGEYDTDNESRGVGTSAGSRETDPDSTERDDGSEGINAGGSNISGAAVIVDDDDDVANIKANRAQNPRNNASDEETELTSGISKPSEEDANKNNTGIDNQRKFAGDDVSAADDNTDNADTTPANEQMQQLYIPMRRDPSLRYRNTPSPASSPSSSDVTEDDISPSSQGRALAALDAANRNSLVPQTSVNVTRVRKIPLKGARFALLGFEMDHPHVKFLLQKMESFGAVHVFLNNGEQRILDLIVVHPPFLQLLHAKDFAELEIRDFLRSRRARFALGLRHLELCIEHERLLDPRIETAEVFPEGVILVVDDTTLALGEEIVQKLVKLLGQAAAASAAASAAKGILHYNQEGARENPPWPWAIKLNNDTVQKLMLQKMQIARTDPNKAWRIENCLKLLHAHKATGDRAGRGARVMGIDWEEASHQPIQYPPQEVRDAVKLASRHGATCRAVFLVSENPETVAEARKHSKVVLSGNLHECCEWLEEVIKEMWAETKSARDAAPWVNVLGFAANINSPPTNNAAADQPLNASLANAQPHHADNNNNNISNNNYHNKSDRIAAAEAVAARIAARKDEREAVAKDSKGSLPPPKDSVKTIARRDSEDSLQNDANTKTLLMQSRPSNDILPDFNATAADKTISAAVNKHQTPWIPGVLKSPQQQQGKQQQMDSAAATGENNEKYETATVAALAETTATTLTTIERANEHPAVMMMTTPLASSHINPSGTRTNFLLNSSGNNGGALTSSQKKKTKTVRFPTTIDDGGTMGAGRRRGRYSPPPSPPRTTSAIEFGDNGDMRDADTLSMREGEGEATVSDQIDLEGSVDEKPLRSNTSKKERKVVVNDDDDDDDDDEDNAKKRQLKRQRRTRSTNDTTDATDSSPTTRSRSKLITRR